MGAPDATAALTTMFDLADTARDAMLTGLGAAADTKGDGTPVTEVDLAINDAVVALVAARHPGVGVLGEEVSLDGGDALFVVDPIDGTAAFSAGLGLPAFSCAYRLDGRTVAAVVDDPWTATRYSAVAGGGTHLTRAGQRRQVTVGERPRSSVFHVEAARGSAWDGVDLDAALHAAGYNRTKCLAFVGPACRVATGAFAGAAFLRPSAWDCAAVALLVEEAGGVATNLDGTPATRGGLHGGLLVAHPAAWRTLSETLRAAAVGELPAAERAPRVAGRRCTGTVSAMSPTTTDGAQLLAELRDAGLDVDRYQLTDAAKAYLAAATYADARPGEAMPAWMAYEYHGWPWPTDRWDPPTDPVACLEQARACLDAEIARISELPRSS